MKMWITKSVATIMAGCSAVMELTVLILYGTLLLPLSVLLILTLGLLMLAGTYAEELHSYLRSTRLQVWREQHWNDTTKDCELYSQHSDLDALNKGEHNE
jgi:hypothetical protein